MMTKREILAAIKRFDADPFRVLSIELFCQVAGISADTYQNVRDGKYEMTEMVQRRLEIAFGKVERGEIKVMRNRDLTKFAAYRKNPQPERKRGLMLIMKNGKIGIRTGPVNPNCYTTPTFEEEIDGNS